MIWPNTMVVSAKEIVQDTEPEQDMHEVVGDCSQRVPAVLIQVCVLHKGKHETVAQSCD